MQFPGCTCRILISIYFSSSEKPAVPWGGRGMRDWHSWIGKQHRPRASWCLPLTSLNIRGEVEKMRTFSCWGIIPRIYKQPRFEWLCRTFLDSGHWVDTHLWESGLHCLRFSWVEGMGILSCCSVDRKNLKDGPGNSFKFLPTLHFAATQLQFLPFYDKCPRLTVFWCVHALSGATRKSLWECDSASRQLASLLSLAWNQ